MSGVSHFSFFYQGDLWKWEECKLFDKLGIPLKNQLFLIFFVHSNPFFSIAFILLAFGDEKNSVYVSKLDYHNSETYAVLWFNKNLCHFQKFADSMYFICLSVSFEHEMNVFFIRRKLSKHMIN